MRIHTIPLGVDNCYLLEGGTCVLIDGGAPNQSRTFMRRMASLGIAPSRVDLIVLTHAHWDHIGTAHALVELTGAKLAIHRAERDIVEGGHKGRPPGVTLWGRIFGGMLDAVVPFISIQPTHVDIEIGDDGFSLQPYGIPGRVVHAPGHTPGSVAIIADSGEAFVGDLAMNGLPLTCGPDLPIFAEDIGSVKESWRKLLKLGIQTAFPAHGRPFDVSAIERKLVTA